MERPRESVSSAFSETELAEETSEDCADGRLVIEISGEFGVSSSGLAVLMDTSLDEEISQDPGVSALVEADLARETWT